MLSAAGGRSDLGSLGYNKLEIATASADGGLLAMTFSVFFNTPRIERNSVLKVSGDNRKAVGFPTAG